MSKLIILFLIIGLATPNFFVFANSGNTTGYAWSTNVGWINFGCDDCSVKVADRAISGYAWSQNYGWINFSPDTGGIINNGGALSGTVWGENTGWINFNGVSIDSQGQFSGTASGDVAGVVEFTNCGTECGVQTSWRPGGLGVVAGAGGNNYTISTKPNFTRSLRFGMNGADVKLLQSFLNSKQILVSTSGAGSPGNESIYFGKKTYNALIKFQKQYASEIFGANKNMPGLGIFGPKTLKLVESLVGV